MARVKHLLTLRRLHRERTRVGDEGVAHLAGLVNLEYLNLYGTKVTDKSLIHLTGLKKLRHLYIWQTGVTDQGVARLEKALPQLEVVGGVDLSTLPNYASEEEVWTPPTATVKWVATSDRGDAPKSGNGINTEIFFENASDKPVKVYWVSFGNTLELYAELGPGATRRQNTYANHTWLVSDKNDTPLGYFIMGVDAARAVIPK